MKYQSIGQAAKSAGLTAKTIRFYEEKGYVPQPVRLESGYRAYSEADIRRLRLVGLARGAGVPLAEVGKLADQAFTLECGEMADELLRLLDRQREDIDRRIAELEELRQGIDDLRSHVEHCQCEPGLTLATCAYCGLIPASPSD